MPAIAQHRKRIELFLPANIYKAVEAYRLTMVNRPSKNFIIAEALVEWLKARSVTIEPSTSTPPEGPR